MKQHATYGKEAKTLQRPTVSLCMIVYNEAHQLERAVHSAQTLVDEVVIVDTGSDDGTLELARKMTPHVYTIPWQDDFAAARNAALDFCRTDWVLWLDADEEIIGQEHDTWHHILTRHMRHYDALLVAITHYTGVQANAMDTFVHTAYRLLRLGADFRYTQPIHEHVDTFQGTYRFGRDLIPSFVIRHYGYMDTPQNQKKKYERNMGILRRAMQRPNYDPWLDYHVASEYYRIGQYRKTLLGLERAMRRFLAFGTLPPALTYTLKYDTLLRKGKVQQALGSIPYALMLYPENVDLHYYYGMLQYRAHRYEDAVNTFQTCFQLGEELSLRQAHVTRRGVGSYLALEMIGLCYEALGQHRQARATFSALQHQYPAYVASQNEHDKRDMGKGEH